MDKALQRQDRAIQFEESAEGDNADIAGTE